MFVGSVQIISRLDSQSKFHMLALFSGRHVGGATWWRLHIGLCEFPQNILTNIWSMGTRRDPKLGEMSFLPISYDITISCLYPLSSFRLAREICLGSTRRIKQTYLNCETVQLEFETKRPIVSLKTAFIQHNDSCGSTVWGISPLLFNLSRAQTLVSFIQNPERKTPTEVKVTQTSKYWKKQVNTTENKQRKCRQKN